MLPSGATSPKKTDIPSQQLLSWTWKFMHLSWIHTGVLAGLFPCRSVYEVTVALSSWMQRPHHVQQIVFPHRLPVPDSYNLSSPLPSGVGHTQICHLELSTPVSDSLFYDRLSVCINRHVQHRETSLPGVGRCTTLWQQR